MTTSQKYELVPCTEHLGFFRIRALQDIPLYNVVAGDLGGIVLGEDNLSQSGQGWIDFSSKVIGNARVIDALIAENSALYDNVQVFQGRILNSELHHDTTIFKDIKIKNSSITDCEFHQGGTINRCRLKNSMFKEEVYLSESVVDAYFGLEVSGFAMWEKVDILILNKGWIANKSEFSNVSIDSVSMNIEIEVVMRHVEIGKNKVFIVKAGDENYSSTRIEGSIPNLLSYKGEILILIDSSIDGEFSLTGELMFIDTELTGMGTISGNIDILHSIISNAPTIEMKKGKIVQSVVSGFSTIHQASSDDENPTLNNIHLTDDEHLVC